VQIAASRKDWEVALGFVQRGTREAREAYAADPELGRSHLVLCLRAEADFLELVGRLDDAMAVDAECLALKPGEIGAKAMVRSATKCMAAGDDAKA
jgi:hypothetical protein